MSGADVTWTPLLAEVALQGNAKNEFPVNDDKPVTHVRLNIFPDGGVARLRVYGEIMASAGVTDPNREIDLAAVVGVEEMGSPDRSDAQHRGGDAEKRKGEADRSEASEGAPDS